MNLGATPVLVLLLSAFISSAATDKNPITEARVGEIAAWLPAKAAGFGRPVTDRAAWQPLVEKAEWAAVIKRAEELARTPIPEVTEELFLDFSRTGNRTRCQKVLSARDGRVVTLAMAECLENHGRFIQPLVEAITAQCREKTWVMPAHDRNLDNFNGRVMDMDLRATLVGWELATLDYLLGEKLPVETRDLIHKEVRRRVLHPFRAIVEGRQKGAYWLKATHNWNSVCLAGVTGAALALEDAREQRAWFVAAAEAYIPNFLSGFTPDGYCSEGVGYWNYGFGRFLMLTEAVRQATGGKLDFLALPAAAAPALYGIRSEIINGWYPSIADCSAGSRPDEQLVRYIAERFNLPAGTAAQARWAVPGGGLAPTMLFTFLPEPLASVPPSVLPKDSPLRTWFSDAGVLICRPARVGPALAAVLKGGHNAEHHNHNDVGSFSVVLGDRMVLCDPGAEVYTARTFSSRRYDSRVLNSFGHSVPVLGGQLQKTGATARGVVLDSQFNETTDTLKLDMRSAYAVSGLRKMERTFTFHRGASPALEVRDQAAFDQPQTFESALITWGSWKQISEEELLVTDQKAVLRVKINTGGKAFTVKSEILDEDVSTRTKPVRISLALTQPVQEAEVTLNIVPEPAPAKPAGL